jgi:hypothetical protein
MFELDQMIIRLLEDRSAMEGFRAPRNMTPDQLGHTLAQLVWESFSDFVGDGDTEVPLSRLGVTTEDGVPDPHAIEEALIFIMWAHTRGAQIAFVGRAPDQELRAGLDALHAAVFEDMVEQGTPRAHLPLFEQRVGARYAEYHQAAEVSDTRLGEVVVRRLTDDELPHERLAAAVRDRAVAVAGPLTDFLEDVELVTA